MVTIHRGSIFPEEHSTEVLGVQLLPTRRLGKRSFARAWLKSTDSSISDRAFFCSSLIEAIVHSSFVFQIESSFFAHFHARPKTTSGLNIEARFTVPEPPHQASFVERNLQGVGWRGDSLQGRWHQPGFYPLNEPPLDHLWFCVIFPYTRGVGRIRWFAYLQNFFSSLTSFFQLPNNFPYFPTLSRRPAQSPCISPQPFDLYNSIYFFCRSS